MRLTRKLDTALRTALTDGEINLADAQIIRRETREGGVNEDERTRLADVLADSAIRMTPRARATLTALREAAPTALPSLRGGVPAGAVREPRYDRLTADGRLQFTFVVGYDESAWSQHTISEASVRSALARQGFVPYDPSGRSESELRAAGFDPATMDPNLLYFTRPTRFRGVPVVARVLLPGSDGASRGESLRHVMEQSGVITYVGHCRYGSGPDVDAIDSPAGNYRIGTPYEAGHVTVPDTYDTRRHRSSEYQFLYFGGCETWRYLRPLRGAGWTPANHDIVFTNQTPEWTWVQQGPDVMLDAVLNRRSVNWMLQELNRRAGEDAFAADGFADNPDVGPHS